MKYCDVANILPWDFEFFFTSLLTGFAWASSWFLIESLLPLMTSAVATNSPWSAGSTSSSPTGNSWSTLHATNCTSLLIAVTIIVILRPATTIPSFLCTAGGKKCFVICVNTPHWKIESPFILLTLYANLYQAKKTINCLSFMMRSTNINNITTSYIMFPYNTFIFTGRYNLSKWWQKTKYAKHFITAFYPNSSLFRFVNGYFLSLLFYMLPLFCLCYRGS